MSGHAHGDTCACGKNGAPEAHGYDPITKHRALSCGEVEAIRGRVAADLTRESMNPAQRLLSWAHGRAGDYTPEAYEAAWAAPSAEHTDGAAR